MSLTVRLSDPDDKDLKAQLDERTAANRQALDARNTDKRTATAAESSVRPAVEARGKNQRAKTAGAVPSVKPEDQTANPVTRNEGFQFYYTICAYLDEGSNEFSRLSVPNTIAAMSSTYRTLTARYGKGWPTGVTEVNSLPPHYVRAGIKYDVPFKNTYSLPVTIPTPDFTLQTTRFSNYFSPNYPPVLPEPFTTLQVKSVEAPAVTFREIAPADTLVPLTQGFAGPLQNGYTRKNNVMLCVSQDVYWDVLGWPAPHVPRPPDGPLWRDGLTGTTTPSSGTRSGGNTMLFPPYFDSLVTYVVRTKPATISTMWLASQVPCRTPTEFPGCTYTCPSNNVCGYYAIRYQEYFPNGPWSDEPKFTTREVLTKDGEDLTPPVRPDTVHYVPTYRWANTGQPSIKPKIHTYIPATLRTIEEASQKGFVVAYMLLDGGAYPDASTSINMAPAVPLDFFFTGRFPVSLYKFPSGRDATRTQLSPSTYNSIPNLIEEALTLDINLLDFRTTLSVINTYPEQNSDTFLAWLEKQYPVAKRIEALVDNPDQKFFGLLSHNVGGAMIRSRFSLNPLFTPYSSLDSALFELRTITANSFNEVLVRQTEEKVDETYKDFSLAVRKQVKELIAIRAKTARAMVAQYLGAETVEAIRQGRLNTAAGRGKLQFK
jgi:hypothetical protein